MVVMLCKPVRFVPHVLQQPQGKSVPAEPQRLIATVNVNQLFTFSERQNQRRRDVQRLERRHRFAELALAAIDQQDVGKDLAIGVEAAKTAGDDLVHAGVIVDALYLANPLVYLASLRHLPDEARVVLIVGHNPGISEWASKLTRRMVEMPTAAVACVTLPIDDWGAINGGTPGMLLDLWLPKKIGG